MADRFIRPMVVKTQLISNSSNQQTMMLESDKVFLERTNVKSILNSLLNSLYHHQPEDPINYICNYFENLSQQGDPVKLSYDRLKSISLSNPVIDDCLLEVYEIFLKASTAVPSGKKAPKLLLADLFNKLVDLLTNEFISEIKCQLIAKLKRKENDFFSFSYFKSSIKLVYLLKEFLSESSSLFTDLQSYSLSNQVNKQVAEILINQLSKATKILSSNTSTTNKNNQTAIQSIYELSPAAIQLVFAEKNFKLMHLKEDLSLEDFLKLVSKVFIGSINL